MTTSTLTNRVIELLRRAEGLDRPASRPWVGRPGALDGILAEVRELFRSTQALEARHVALALAEPEFPFADAQGELAARRRDLAVIVDGVRGRLAPLLTRDEVRELERVAILCCRAPLTSQADLDAMRAARQARALAG